MGLFVQDIVLNESAFNQASQDMSALKTRTDTLKSKMETMYSNLVSALDTPAGEALDLDAKDVIIEPVENLLLIIGHVSETLNEINGTGYYKDVFVKFEELNDSIKF